ncbi:hypothetical protein HDV57DRAFT_484758 [Trichoderma longibrachiatum]|uniref:Uncharacterized protein n=1 Tax=Trichoderma longibrachiatum ATCC 18648 TaxID=983965 RepID=A0A2T4CDD0_TRILO|nr:hypothetical protein M440DRAFT_240870 [Trichoderma longibrachiatum ATCC 18648]
MMPCEMQARRVFFLLGGLNLRHGNVFDCCTSCRESEVDSYAAQVDFRIWASCLHFDGDKGSFFQSIPRVQRLVDLQTMFAAFISS